MCRGRGVRLGDLLRADRASGLKVEVRVARPAAPHDVPVLVGDPSRLRAATGGEARTPLSRTPGDCSNTGASA